MSDALPLDLPAVEPQVSARSKPAQPVPLVPGADWGVVDHVCGKCFARLVGHIVDGRAHYRCTGCGRETPHGGPGLAMTPGPNGRRAPTICSCHLRFGGRDAGLRCVVNDRRTPDNPTEIVARQVL